VTPGTLARIAILQLQGRRYRDSNPGSRFNVISYEARPLLKLFPPEGASDSKVQTYTFIEAVQKLPTCFTPEEIDKLFKKISTKLYGKLRSILVVVTDDMVKKGPNSNSKSGSGSGSGSASKSKPNQNDRNNKRSAPASTSPSGPPTKEKK
jgi:hypothetical protein